MSQQYNGLLLESIKLEHNFNNDSKLKQSVESLESTTPKYSLLVSQKTIKNKYDRLSIPKHTESQREIKTAILSPTDIIVSEEFLQNEAIKMKLDRAEKLKEMREIVNNQMKKTNKVNYKERLEKFNKEEKEKFFERQDIMMQKHNRLRSTLIQSHHFQE